MQNCCFSSLSNLIEGLSQLQCVTEFPWTLCGFHMKQFPIKNFLLVCGSSGKTNVKCNNENLMKRLLGTHTNSWEILQLKRDVNIAKSNGDDPIIQHFERDSINETGCMDQSIENQSKIYS